MFMQWSFFLGKYLGTPRAFLHFAFRTTYLEGAYIWQPLGEKEPVFVGCFTYYYLFILKDVIEKQPE